MKELTIWYENLSLENLNEISKFYSDDCYFRDPFNELHSLGELKKLYIKMFKYLKDPKFKIVHVFKNENIVSLYWEFDFVLLKKEFKICGNSLLKLNSEEKIVSHVDYWDSVQEWWVKLPLIGAILKLFI